MRIAIHFFKVFMTVVGILFLMVVSGLIKPYEPVEIAEPIVAIAPVLIAALISAGMGVAKMIAGGIKKRRGEKQMDTSIEDLKYTRPEEHQQIMGLLGKRESGISSRRRGTEERIRETTASGMAGIRQLADSPVAALGAYSGLKEREQMAISDIGLQFEGKRDEAIMGQVGGLQMGADYSDKETFYNDMYKKMVNANLGASKMSGGMNQGWQGAEGVVGTAMDYLGTRYMGNKMNPQDTGVTEDLGSAAYPS